MLKSLFKPKWQHPDQAIRHKALSNLDCEQDLELIKKMAVGDPSIELRDAALNKMNCIDSLTELLNSVEVADDWFRVALRINQLRPQLDNLINSFNQISNSWTNEAKLQAIGKCKDVELANALVFSTNDVNAFFNLALSARSIDLRLKAVEKIEEIDKLQQLSKKATNKQVIKAVKTKLNIAKDKQKKIDITLEQAERLLSNIKKLSQQSWFDAQYHIKINNLVTHWQELDLLVLEKKNEFESSFHSAHEECLNIIAVHQQKFEQEALELDAANKQKGLCTELEKLITEMKSDSMTTIELFQSVMGALKILDDNWVQTVEAITPKIDIKKKYENLRRQLCDSFKPWQNLIEQKSDIETHFLVVPENSYQPLKDWLGKWRQLESRLQWSKSAAKPTILDDWHELSFKYQESYNKLVASQKKKAQYINQKLHLLEKHCNQKNLIAANKLINYIEAKSEALIADFKVSFQKRMEQISPQLEELRDWHSFATKPKKESLCLEMEELLLVESEPLEKARQVRDLQNQWRALAASNSATDEQLWDRFKQASDSAYLPCLKYYAEQDKVRAENLTQQNNICEQLEKLDFVGSEESSTIDWKKLESTLNNAAQEWKSYHPVPENERQLINKRFNDISNHIRNELKAEKQRNLDLRCELIDKAEKLLNLEDSNIAVSQAINLQKQWKAIGFTFFKADREKWQLFRSVLDKVFEKRDAVKKEFKAELESNLTKLKEITTQISQLCETEDNQLKLTYERFIELKESWISQTELPKASAKNALVGYDLACTKYQEHFSGLTNRLQEARTASLLKLMKSLESIEEQLLEGMSDTNEKTVNEQTINEMEQESNSFLGEQNLKDIIKVRIEDLTKIKVHQMNTEGVNQLQTLALETEILLGIDSPEEYKSQRMEIQLKQLQNGIGQSSVDFDKQKIIWDMFKQWLSVGFIDKVNRQQLEARRILIFSAADV